MAAERATVVARQPMRALRSRNSGMTTSAKVCVESRCQEARATDVCAACTDLIQGKTIPTRKEMIATARGGGC